MDFSSIIIIICIAIYIIASIIQRKIEKRITLMSPEELEVSHEIDFGNINKTMLCPHCQCAGRIRTKEVKQKKGVSGSKATAAILTGGVSLLAVGLSRKELTTQAHCDNCNNTWFL